MQPLTPTRVLLWLTVAMGALLFFVSLVGFVTGSVPGTAVLGTIGTIVTGLIASLALRINAERKDGDK